MDEMTALLKSAERQLTVAQDILDSVQIESVCNSLEELVARHKKLDADVRAQKAILLEAVARACGEFCPSVACHIPRSGMYYLFKDLTIGTTAFQAREISKLCERSFDHNFWILVNHLLNSLKQAIPERIRGLDIDTESFPDVITRLHQLQLPGEA